MMTSKSVYAALLGMSLALPMGVMAQEPAAIPQAASPQTEAAPASDAMTRDQAKAQRKQQKANEKAAKDNAKAAKDQAKSIKQQDKATNSAEKARASAAAAPATATPATTAPPQR